MTTGQSPNRDSQTGPFVVAGEGGHAEGIGCTLEEAYAIVAAAAARTQCESSSESGPLRWVIRTFRIRPLLD